jgi:hypothetical protein
MNNTQSIPSSNITNHIVFISKEDDKEDSTSSVSVSSSDLLGPMYKAITEKWKALIIEKIKEQKSLDHIYVGVEMDTEGFTNCHGVKFNNARINYNKLEKTFSIHVNPSFRQDILCINDSEYECRNICVNVQGNYLKKLFKQFFQKVNTVHFCQDCGNFCEDPHFYLKFDMCERCVFEEIACSSKVETKMCSICQEETKRSYKTICGHHFHRRCLAKVNPVPFPRCPICRHCLDDSNSYIDDEDS